MQCEDATPHLLPRPETRGGEQNFGKVVSMPNTIKLLSRLVLWGAAAVLVVLIAGAACDHGEPRVKISFYDGKLPQQVQYDPERQLKALLTGHPVDDADAAYRRGDKRFIGLLGNSVVIPGVQTNKETDAAVEKRGVKVVCGTTDYTRTELQTKICEAAAVYASKYNQRLLEISKSLGQAGKQR